MGNFKTTEALKLWHSCTLHLTMFTPNLNPPPPLPLPATYPKQTMQVEQKKKKQQQKPPWEFNASCSQFQACPSSVHTQYMYQCIKVGPLHTFFHFIYFQTVFSILPSSSDASTYFQIETPSR